MQQPPPVGRVARLPDAPAVPTRLEQEEALGAELAPQAFPQRAPQSSAAKQAPV